MEKRYLLKAREKYRAGVLLCLQGYYNDSLSRLYYAFRFLAICIAGEPEKGRWKHSALMKKLIMEIDNRKLFPLSRQERKLIKDFPDVRKSADYDLVDIPKEKVKTYIKLVERFIREVENYAESDNQN
jgi:uncharacterized protein (UPF0332 family)